MTTNHRRVEGVSDLARFVFLASELHLALPITIIKNVPQGDLIASVSAEGIAGASSSFDISPDQLDHLRFIGSQLGPASEAEFRSLLTKHAVLNLEARRSSIHISKYMAMTQSIANFYFMNDDGLIDDESVTLDQLQNMDLEDISKFKSGFEPFDLITQGFFQGVIIMGGKTGHGKTTAMLALMKYLRETNQVDEQWFYETEIPLKMMKYKLRKIQPGLFTDKDYLYCGSANIDIILEKIKENPNPNRVIYIDSPDVMAGGTGEGKRFYLESIYRKLINIKLLSKMVVVASQTKQKDREITLTSLSDSFDKARYCDMFMGWRRLRIQPDGTALIKANVPKNRFGIPDQSVTFSFDYNTFDSEISNDALDDMIIADDEDEDDSW